MEEMYSMTTDTTKRNDPHAVFAEMSDEEVVLEAQANENVLAQEFC